MGRRETQGQAKKPSVIYKERITALLKFDPLKKTVLSMIDEKLVSDYWRSGKTRIYAIRGKEGKLSMADTYKPVSGATINRDLAVLKRVLNIAREWKYPVQQFKIRELFGEEGKERIVTHEEELAYLAAAPELLKDFAAIAIDTGLRPDSELRVMT